MARRVRLNQILAHPKRREERAKLLATFLSNLGAAAVIAGMIAPTFTGTANGPDVVVGFLVGVGLHLTAQAVLQWVVVDQTEPPQ